MRLKIRAILLIGGALGLYTVSTFAADNTVSGDEPVIAQKLIEPVLPITGEIDPLNGLAHPGIMPMESKNLTADVVFADSQSRVFQVRTLLKESDKKTSTGSGFLVGADGLAITNYHVVSQYVFDPDLYRIEYEIPGKESGKLTLYAIDVINDLAIVKIDQPVSGYFEFDSRALTDKIAKGERLYSLGMPMEMGPSIVEGTYNGLVQGEYQPRIHFTGAINSGMSGGPAVSTDNTIVGVNVARSLGGQLVGFLVPAIYASELLTKARADGPLEPKMLKRAIGQQLMDWQQRWTATLLESETHPIMLGPYSVPDSKFDWINCWAGTNANEEPAPRFLLNSNRCQSRSSLFIASELYNNYQITSNNYYLKNDNLNRFAFTKAISDYSRIPWRSFTGDKYRTPARCHEDFVAPQSADDQPPLLLRVTWCLRAYRDFDGIYDIVITTVTQNLADEALISKLTLSAVSYENAIALTRFFLHSIKVRS